MSPGFSASLWVGVALILSLAACDRSPEAAKKKLAAENVTVDAPTLMAKTKEAQAGEKTASLLVQAGVDPNARQANGMTALMSAVFNGQHETASLLLERGADVNATAKGFTALRLAVERNDLKMVRLLLDRGANPTLKAEGAPSALEKAQEGGGATDIARLLADKAGK